MNETEYLFGMEAVRNGGTFNNELTIQEEICDLRGVVRELQERGYLQKLKDTQWVNHRALLKIEKLKKFMEYSKQKGIIT